MIVIKPRAAGTRTNLLLHFRQTVTTAAVSRSEDYRCARSVSNIPMIRIDEGAARQRSRGAPKQEFEASQIAPVESIENLYFDYRIQGGDENMRPVRVV